MNRWFIILTAVAIYSCIGVFYSWGVFVPSLSEKFGWTRAQLGWPFLISLYTFTLVMVAAAVDLAGSVAAAVALAAVAPPAVGRG
jgi:hypothetical protein